jgi:hypothetical protein
MNLSLSTLSAQVLALAFAVGAPALQAQTLKVKCETRSGRSTASVDGKSLAAGNYTAMLKSGANSAQTGVQPTVKGEVEFDFSSQPRDIRKGATAIAADFIVNGEVVGSLIDSNGQTVISRTQACRVR